MIRNLKSGAWGILRISALLPGVIFAFGSVSSVSADTIHPVTEPLTLSTVGLGLLAIGILTWWKKRP